MAANTNNAQQGGKRCFMPFIIEEEKRDDKNFENVVVPDMTYKATLKSYRTYEKVNSRTGEKETRLALTFELQGKNGTKEIPGFVPMRWYVTREGKTSLLRKWMAALQNKSALAEDLNRDLDALVGAPCQVKTITKGEGPEAKSMVEDVFPIVSDEELPF